MAININDNILGPELQRTYEISLWTLQDSFIAVLADSTSYTRGYIEDPTMHLSNDGTQELDFSLPMYIDDGITRVRSQIWSQMTDAVTIAGMRKIKVIFNKGVTVANGAEIDAERIYEFIITRVTDTHEQNRPMCEIHCEGLAFQELGKLGYKISLSREEFEADQAENNELIPNIDYWNQKIGLTPYPNDDTNINSSIWYYRIQMDWSAYELSHTRSSDIVYEESYIASYNDETLDATSYEDFREKWRHPSASGSNIYNLTQEIAKTFGVYCRYDYLYNENYHIIGRIVTYYNNFIDEQNRLEFTYPYTSKRITRENDCTDLVTKMYVNTFESAQSSAGLVTIMDNPVNPTGEDYLLNFDYLYAIGTITDEQYKGIKDFSIAIRDVNNQILDAQNILIKQETVDNIYSAELQVLINTINEEQEVIDKYNKYIANQTGGIQRRSLSDRDVISVVGGAIKFREEGVITNTIKLYDYEAEEGHENDLVSFSEIGQGQFVTGATIHDSSVSIVYAEYTYYPELYYDEVRNSYQRRKAKDTQAKNALEAKIAQLQTEINNANTSLDTLLAQKEQLIKDFEALMGPALREGNWTPDDYSNIANSTYQFIGKLKTTSLENISHNIVEIQENLNGPPAKLIWDTVLNYNETDIKYREGNEDKYYYYLSLTSNMLSSIQQYYAQSENINTPFGLLWYDENPDSEIRPSKIVKFLALGSNCECSFVYQNNTVIPILMLTDLTESVLDDICNHSKLYLCGLTTEIVTDENDHETIVSVLIDPTLLADTSENMKSLITTGTSSMKICRPRFRINDLTLFTDEQNLKLKYNNADLNMYEDYWAMQIVNVQSEDIGQGYDIIIKPEFLIKHWNSNANLVINYNCSQISTMVYLDAVQILKENAYPKVTYSIEPNLMYKDFFYTDYNALNKIAFINDNELDFNQVQGYISSVQLNLNKPWEDTIEVKNYKNKFEDIFSTIVAQTEGMQKNEAAISTIGNAVNMDGTLSQVNLAVTIPKINLKYTLSNGTISINKTDGILSQGENGYVAFKSDGIFYSDNNQNWSPAITPRGINAAAITYGTLTLVNANLGNGALVVKDGAFNLASNKLNLNSEDCTFNLSGTHMTLKSNSGVFILDGSKIDINSQTGTITIPDSKLTLNTEDGLNTVHTVSDVNKGNITIGNGILQSSSITQNNGEDVATLGIFLQDGLLSITSKNNLNIGNQNIEDYVKSNSRTVIQTWWGELSNIPISSINVGQTSASRGVFITENTFRLGRRARMNDGNEPEFLYENENGSTHIIRCLKLGSILRYSNFTSETSSFVGWALDGTNHSLTYTNNSVEISKISPTEFNFNNYLKIDSNGIKITDLALEKTSEHIITFKNNELNTDDYKLKITSEGLFYSLDDGTTWNQVAIITPEPTPDPTPGQEEPEQEP